MELTPLSPDYESNVRTVRTRLRVGESFDVIERHIDVAGEDMALFYVDGFTKDGEMLRIMQELMKQKNVESAESLLRKIPYVEVECATHFETVIRAILSGQSALFYPTFLDRAILIDTRTYPARTTAEPDSDKVMQGARDGFVETLVMNTALIRRRIRDERLVMEHFAVGGAGTDVVVAYMKGVADRETLDAVRKKLGKIKPASLTLGFQSLAECLIRSGWFNPFPKIRTTERPDTAAAEIVEGSVIVICDTSPQVMILPTSIFDYVEETDDFYFPPLTGTYLRLVRFFILALSLVITPLWYLALEYAHVLPDSLAFIVPDDSGALPIILQLFLVEIAIDGLKIASMNTPDLLSNSLSVVGALILGDFAVGVGWLCEDVILYMAFVAIANFAQQNHELGYAIKFVRVMILTLTALFNIWGFVLGLLTFFILVLTNRTVTGKRHYLYPLFPFNAKVFLRLFVREKKQDFYE